MRSLTGSGGPQGRFTDTVGVLTSWTDGVLSITRRSGESVRLDEDAVVAGKVIPREPARRRGIPSADARELQEVSSRGWPAVETEKLGDWTFRAGFDAPVEPPGDASPDAEPAPVRQEGFTARANSVLPVGDPGLPTDRALDEAERWYDARGLTPLVQVATGADGSGELLAATLEARGWTAERHALMRVGALAPLADREPDPRVQLSRTPDERWLTAYRRTGCLRETAWKVLTGGPSVWFATLPSDEPDGAGPPAAIGRCVIDGRWAGFAAVEVAPDRRREGLATAVMGELARRALDEGASAAYLQVETGNTAALALYDRLGFAPHHAYHYRRAPRS